MDQFSSVFSYTNEDFIKEVSSNSDNNSSSRFDVLLMQRWEAAEKEGLFRYKLDGMKSRVLPGKFSFLAQLNVKRAIERRKPQTITSIVQEFNATLFNFTKVRKEEILFEMRKTGESANEEQTHLLIINVSPLEYCNSLLVPFVEKCLPQILTEDGLRLAIELLLLSKTSTLRIGFNSLCAYASVNHFHFHIFYLKHKMYLETVPVKLIAKDCYEVTDFAIPGFLYVFEDQEMDEVTKKIMLIVGFLIQNNIAHNLFLTRGKGVRNNEENTYSAIRIFIWTRKHCGDDKDKTAFNVACCELSGHLPVKDEASFYTLTEGDIISDLQDSCVETFREVQPKIVKLMNQQ